ncbi:MAG: hypothetical protein L0J65_03600 [Alkalibacterium sp.]|nr:hypothetical protein [Alkalibacterium sp.]
MKSVYEQLVIIKKRLHINDRLLSESVGQADNWFSDAKKNMEDIRVSSLLRILSSLTAKINIKQDDQSEQIEFPFNELFTNQVLWLTSIYLELKDSPDIIDDDFLYQCLSTDSENLRGLMPTLRAIKEDEAKLSEDERVCLRKLLVLINEGNGVSR